MDAFEKSLNDIIESLSRQVNQGSDGGNNIRHIMAGVTLALRTYRAYKTKTEINVYDKEETYPNCTVQVLTVEAEPIRHSCVTDNGCCLMCGSPIPTDSGLDYIARNEVRYCYLCGAKTNGKEKEKNEMERH